jgi:hypothetical protein
LQDDLSFEILTSGNTQNNELKPSGHPPRSADLFFPDAQKILDKPEQRLSQVYGFVTITLLHIRTPVSQSIGEDG